MKTLVVLYGEENFLIDKYILDIKGSLEPIKYDLSEVNINNLLEEASSQSLFDDRKVVVGYNATFLSASQNKESITHNLDNFNRYIDNPNPNTTLILVVPYEKLDKRKAIVKKILSTVEVKECNKLKEDAMIKFANDIFKTNNYQISFKALNMLIERIGNNLYLLNSECEKLMLYKMDDNIIEDNDIEEMVEKYDFDNIFSLTDAVIKKNINKSLTLYKELLKRGEEPIKIIVLLANQFRLIFQVKRLSGKGFSESEIAKELVVHPYRVKLAKESNLKEEQLLYYIEALANLDEDIKTGKTNKEIGLELFLLKL